MNAPILFRGRARHAKKRGEGSFIHQYVSIGQQNTVAAWRGCFFYRAGGLFFTVPGCMFSALATFAFNDDKHKQGKQAEPEPSSITLQKVQVCVIPVVLGYLRTNYLGLSGHF